MQKVSVPNYGNFDNFDMTFVDLIGKPKTTINVNARIKAVRIKKSTREWFDGETAEKIHAQDNYTAKDFKSTKLYVDEGIYKEAQKVVQTLI